MTDEIPKEPSGYRGKVVLDKAEPEKKTKINITPETSSIGGKWRYDKETGQMVPVDHNRPNLVNAPFVIPDEMPATEFMGNNNREMYTSKRLLERRNQIAADEINKRTALRNYKPTREELIDDFRREANAVKYGEVQFTEKERELCRREERMYLEYKKRQKR